MEITAMQELLAFFKALADANRLKIVGLLAGEPSTVDDLATMVSLSPSTVSHHLSRLADIGLVSARPQGRFNIYQLETGVLEDMARRLLARDDLPTVGEDVDMDAYDRSIVNRFSHPDGRLKALPAEQKKLLAVLRYVVLAFEPGVRYSEKQVKELLAQFYEDTTTLRRLLVDFRFMDRDSGVYWRLGQDTAEG